jgi:uncharacterized protein (TIGR03437 family)
VPGGTVRFVDPVNNTALGAATLDGGIASLALPQVGAAVSAVYLGDDNCLASAAPRLDLLTPVNAASYDANAFAPDEIVSLFGPLLALEGASPAVQVIDSSGVASDAKLLFSSPEQATVVLPADIARGPGILQLSTGNRRVTSAIQVAGIAPGLFASDSSGQGPAAAQLIRVHPNGTQDLPLAITGPIEQGDRADTLYVILYGTGIRHSVSQPICTLAGKRVDLLYAGAHASFPGLDQINIRLAGGLQGAGVLGLTLTVDGIDSNTVTLTFR